MSPEFAIAAALAGAEPAPIEASPAWLVYTLVGIVGVLVTALVGLVKRKPSHDRSGVSGFGVGCKAETTKGEIEELRADVAALRANHLADMAAIRTHQSREDAWNEDVRRRVLEQWDDALKVLARVDEQMETRAERSEKLRVWGRVAEAMSELAKATGKAS